MRKDNPGRVKTKCQIEGDHNQLLITGFSFILRSKMDELAQFGFGLRSRFTQSPECLPLVA